MIRNAECYKFVHDRCKRWEIFQACIHLYVSIYIQWESIHHRYTAETPRWRVMPMQSYSSSSVSGAIDMNAHRKCSPLLYNVNHTSWYWCILTEAYIPDRYEWPVQLTPAIPHKQLLTFSFTWGQASIQQIGKLRHCQSVNRRSTATLSNLRTTCNSAQLTFSKELPSQQLCWTRTQPRSTCA